MKDITITSEEIVKLANRLHANEDLHETEATVHHFAYCSLMMFAETIDNPNDERSLYQRYCDFQTAASMRDSLAEKIAISDAPNQLLVDVYDMLAVCCAENNIVSVGSIEDDVWLDLETGEATWDMNGDNLTINNELENHNG